MNQDQQFPTTDSIAGVQYKAEQLSRIETIVDDMHHRLFGNGQPGIVTVYNERINDLEADRDKFLGVVKFVKTMAVITPLIVGALEGLRLYLQLHPKG